MKTKVTKKKSSSRTKPPSTRSTAKKKSSLQKKHTPPKKKVVKKKAPVRKTATPKKRVAKKKVPTRKTSTPKKRVVKKKAPTRKTSTPKKKVIKKKAPVRKTRTLKKKAVKKKASIRKITSARSSATKGKVRKLPRSKKYMDTRQLEYFRSILLSRREELISEAGRMVDYMQTDSNTYADAIDQASQEEEFTLQLKERDRERKLLQKIDEAIAKIDKKEYGYCVSCGAEIGVSRLEARPTTDQCIDCKEIDEIKERHY